MKSAALPDKCYCSGKREEDNRGEDVPFWTDSRQIKQIKIGIILQLEIIRQLG